MQVPLTVLDHLRRAEQCYGDRVAVVDDPTDPAGSWGEITYRQLAERARAQAAGLDALGIAEGDRVAIVSKNSARLLTSFFGICAFGRVIVPINFRLHADEVRYIMEHSGARVLLVDPELDEGLAHVEAEHRFVLGEASDRQLYRFGAEPQTAVRAETDILAVNYTSGTTARPKGVEISHRSVWINSSIFGWELGISDRDVHLHVVPMFHANGWGFPFAVTAMGARHVVVRDVDGANILRLVEDHGVTTMGGAPAVVKIVLDAVDTGRKPARNGRLRWVVAGAPPPTAIIERVERDLGWEFVQIYGLTETAPPLTINRSRAEHDHLDPAKRAELLSRAGIPVLGVELRTDESGEVLARGNTMLERYLDQPEATAEALRDGWFHTGDGGTLDDEHFLTISDRKKDVIISGGENISSIEVEDVLFSHPDVTEVAVIGVPSERWGETVLALVVLADGAQTTGDQLIEYSRSKLAHYKCPTRVEMREELNRTATGKLQKFKLREPYWVGYERRVH